MPKNQLAKFSVLVADSNEHMTSIIASMLRAIGVRGVVESNDGNRAVGELRHRAFDALVIDSDLKGIDAIALVKSLRADPLSPNQLLPVIMTSSVPDADRIIKARDAGVTEFLRKPFAASHLNTRLLSIVANPRPFITAPTYAGPDRRRKTDTFKGSERRTRDKAEKAG